ncbi:sugar transferase [Nocardia sp. CDC159]|uniref:Sugar transferase n=1 Tax=Nocardia pulmonis TaxID=2951408 RepID=A0A9X2J1B7_9NOCA|nr:MULTISPECIES: sugar transferase [Nocardia]MCM6777940.1 sugar transferase [Nocardia pulmonis]MCM6790889.1 sugar transferase [Nocardia sp. CDC159]
MFRGYLALAGAELTNTSRLVAHARPGVPQSMEEALAQCRCAGVRDYVRYDDSWPGLAAFLGDDPYVLDNAPWYDPDIPQSSEFLGIWVVKVDGFGQAPVERTVSDAICAGGVTGPHRDKARALTIEAVLVGCTHAGVTYGAEWLACRLRDAAGLSGTTLEYLAAHPEDSAADPASLRRTLSRVVLTREIRITQMFGTRRSEHRQGAVAAVDWEMGALDPYTYGPATNQTITWASSVVEQIEWAHPPNCEAPESCSEIPLLASATCIPATVDITPVQPPVCAGCVPLCQVQTRVAALPAAAGVICRDQVVSYTVTAGAEPVSVNFWVRPCGSTALCDRTGFLSLAGLPAGATVVADSVSGRAYGLVSGQQVRQVGIVHTPSGAPWTSTVLDAGGCWELVAQHEPGIDFTVQVSVRGRQA